jgi:hypothetical protein
MKITGNIKQIYETITFESGFQKRILVVTTNEMYPQDLPIEFVKDGVHRLDSFRVGQDVEISINLRGSEYNGKYYLSAQGWRIELETVANDLPE